MLVATLPIGDEFYNARKNKKLAKELLSTSVNTILLMKEFDSLTESIVKRSNNSLMANTNSRTNVFDDTLSKTNSIIKR